jgi:hypothetical protein
MVFNETFLKGILFSLFLLGCGELKKQEEVDTRSEEGMKKFGREVAVENTFGNQNPNDDEAFPRIIDLYLQTRTTSVFRLPAEFIPYVDTVVLLNDKGDKIPMTYVLNEEENLYAFSIDQPFEYGKFEFVLHMSDSWEIPFTVIKSDFEIMETLITSFQQEGNPTSVDQTSDGLQTWVNTITPVTTAKNSVVRIGLGNIINN